MPILFPSHAVQGDAPCPGCVLLAFFGFGLLATPATAQSDYPNRTVRIVVPATPHPAAAATCLPGWSRSLDSGKLRALGVTGAKRSEALPDVPTIAESALPGYQALQWFGILAPAGAPAPVVQLLQTRIAEGMRSAETKARLAADGAEAVASTPAEFAALINEEIEKWTVLAKAANIQPQE